ncbi:MULTISPECIES: RHS repeat domain-containing protein [unclassified Brevundimonas]|uniref:RHS repeat domain-containing protein n=1 Tax=unclassified Brevundimonas TaxID=2622653 RepID=UPI001431E83F|nr:MULTISPECIES: RHS repeat-associated core domain-containing protein [unclassified Brevundimonas]
MNHNHKRGARRVHGRDVSVLALILAGALSSPALAQVQPIPPEFYQLDGRGVDLARGTFNYSTTEVVIGQPGAGGLAYGRSYLRLGSTWRNNLLGNLTISGSVYTVAIGASAQVFISSGPAFNPVIRDGATLSRSGDIFTYTTADGVQARFRFYSPTTYPTNRYGGYPMIDLRHPNGELRTYDYEETPYCTVWWEWGECAAFGAAMRLTSVVNNYGYAINFDYASNDPDIEGVEQWLDLRTVQGRNLAYPAIWGPSVTYDNGFRPTVVTDQDSRETHYAYNSWGSLSGVRLPGDAADTVSVTYDTSVGRVSGVTDASGSWSYASTVADGLRTMIATGPMGQQITAVSDEQTHRLRSVTDALGREASYQYDTGGRTTRVTRPEGDATVWTYDARGNRLTETRQPTPGSAEAPVTTTWTYPEVCANPVTCNQPTAMTDARGHVTDYTYDPAHGGMTSVTGPAPTIGAVRPQTRIAYAAQTGSGFSAPGGAITLPVSVSACATLASCAGTADEVRRTIAYAGAGGANNLLPTSTSTGAGDGSLTATTSQTYTPFGDVARVDGPLTGTEDSVHYRYDTARRSVGVIGPDPDGAGPLPRRASRITYDPAGRVVLQEVGTVVGLSEPDWAAFVSLQQTAVVHDPVGRPTHQRVQAGGQTFALTQLGYDAAGRVECATTRMDPAAFAAPPADACALGPVGAFGPDRILRTAYDAVGRPVSTTSGHGTADPITESVAYTANSQVASLTDGRGNVSVMEYDGLGRLSLQRYPNPTGGGTSTTDYEQYGYDAAGNLVTMRDRAGQTTTAAYDALGRVTQVAYPGATPDVATTYDLLGRPLTVSTPGQTLTQGWDALGRLVTETGPLGTMASQYDLAGRRTRLTWPDGFFAAYDYNLAGELTGVRENGTDWPLAAFAYDALGRRIGQTNANGSIATWAYDGAGRLASLGHALVDAPYNVTLGFSYNPAGQIVARSVSNPAYDQAPTAGTTAYANDGLNRVTAVDGAGVTYDTLGNLTAAPGTPAYGYDTISRLTSAGSSSMAYDPAGRLAQTTGAATTRFLYDGLQLIGEYDAAGTLVRRHVPGAGLDGVIASYEGTTFDRRWLLADERGSVLTLSNNAGAVTALNTYDEYGVPRPNNAGTFQYTGQVWLPEAQLYHYRARAYLPGLGRFAQADPLGYAAGANLYAYVGADPMNWIDPLGLMQEQDAWWVDDVWVFADRIRTGPPGGGDIVGGCGPQWVAQVSTDSVRCLANLGLGRPGTHHRPGQRPEAGFCEGYSDTRLASTIAGYTSDLATLARVTGERSPARFVPQAQGYLQALRIIELIGSSAATGAALWLAYRYEDYSGAAEALARELAGSGVASAYRRLPASMRGASGDLATDLMSLIVPQGINIESAGPCRNRN